MQGNKDDDENITEYGVFVHFIVPLKSGLPILYFVDSFSQHSIAAAKENVDYS